VIAALGTWVRERASWLAPPWLRAPLVLLGLITLVGATLRFWGIFHGLREGLIYHPDATLAVSDAWRHYLGASWAQTRFSSVYSLLLVLAMWTVDALGRFVGYPPNWSFELIASTSSLLAAALGTATIPVVYLLGARGYDRPAGLLAAALFSVCPLHSFQSHYPYRDVPMVFFLALTLLACLAIVQRPTLPAFALGGLAAAITAALKPAGFAVAAPLLVASAVGLSRVRRLWMLVATCVLFAVALGALPVLRGAQWSAPGPMLWRFGEFVLGYLDVGLFQGTRRAVGYLLQWLGLPYVAAMAAGVGYGIWCRRPSDLVFLAFWLPAFIAASLYRYLDERFLVFLLPAGAVMLGRAVTEAWAGGRRLKAGRIVVGVAVGGLLLAAFLQSAWQGIILSLPDTRALAGRWFEAQVPRTTKVAVERDAPLGVERWSGATLFDPTEPFSREAAKADLLVTSSRSHRRYFDNPELFPKELSFFRELPQNTRLIKSFSLVPLGFTHSTIEVYSTDPPASGPFLRFLLPRPYDTRWNAGVSFLDSGPYDRDDRTLWLSEWPAYRATLVSPTPVEEMAVFVLNGPMPSRVRVRVGWTSKTRSLEPGEWRVLRFRPWRAFPRRPALYRFEVGLTQRGGKALVQLRSGAREIGEAYAQWGRWESAIPYLERVVAESPSDPEPRLLLATAYERVGQGAAARQTLERLVVENSTFMDGYLRLGRSDASPESWAHAFRQLTGLEPSLLTFALTQEVVAEPIPQRAGRPVQDPTASGVVGATFEKERDRAGAHYGASVYLAQGAYRARFPLRAWQASGAGPLAVAKVFAAERLLASQSITAKQLGLGQSFAEVPVPFSHTDQGTRVKVLVEATGLASLAIGNVRIEPDLRETLRQRLLGLEALRALLP